MINNKHLIAYVLCVILGSVIGLQIIFTLESFKKPTKAANKGYCVTLYNHDGSIRGQYHNVNNFSTSLSARSTYGSASSVLYLQDYEVYVSGDYVISPEKD